MFLLSNMTMRSLQSRLRSFQIQGSLKVTDKIKMGFFRINCAGQQIFKHWLRNQWSQILNFDLYSHFGILFSENLRFVYFLTNSESELERFKISCMEIVCGK